MIDYTMPVLSEQEKAYQIEMCESEIERLEITLKSGSSDTPHHVKSALVRQKIALAALTAKPVERVNADQMHRVCLEANRHLDKYGAMAKEVNKLIRRTPPVPVKQEGEQ